MKRLILIPCLLALSLSAEAGRRGPPPSNYPNPYSPETGAPAPTAESGGGNDVIYGGPLYWLRHGYNVITGKRGQNPGGGDNGGGGGVTDPGPQPRK